MYDRKTWPRVGVLKCLGRLPIPLCSRYEQPQKALARLMPRLGVPVGGRVRKLRAVGDQPQMQRHLRHYTNLREVAKKLGCLRVVAAL